MAEIITLVIDIALGALAYRLAYSNKRALEQFKAQVTSEIAGLHAELQDVKIRIA